MKSIVSDLFQSEIACLTDMSKTFHMPRILRFRLRLTRFNYAIQHVPGKLLYTADTLSRAPLWEETDKNSQDRTESLMEVVISDLPASKQ